MTRRCWGILREREHSPGRETDDAEILGLTGKALESKGFDVKILDPDALGALEDPLPDGVFLMCEREAALTRLRDWEIAGVQLVNSPVAVWNTYRERMIPLLEEANVRFVPSEIVATTDPTGTWSSPRWVKRADVHNTQEGDVVFAATTAEVRAALEALAVRGIPRAVIQPHVAGDLIKFYGIGGGAAHGGPAWFRWFYHKEQELSAHPFDRARLGRLARRAAAALGLEIYGGDAIATADGDLVVLDLNAWPSFALYRDEAAAHIAAHLALRFRGGRR
ncbi:MAG: hypothetical protein DMD91_30875 [Candidatus Rokuibacteriota bacterium]|nr:MAG: hypothetical protein DMD91_30875 [Candidatus Rokubacteria bacterium]